MNHLLENVGDMVGIVLQGLPTSPTDASGAWESIEQNEDFVGAAVRAFIGIVQRGSYSNKAGMIKHISDQGEAAIQRMISDGNMVLIVAQEGDVVIFSQKQRNKLPKVASTLENSSLRLFGDSEVAWSSRLDGEPVPTTIDVVLGGKNPVVDKPSKVAGDLGPRAKSDLRHKFWGQGGANPKGEPGEWDQAHAEEIVNKLLK